MMSFATPTTRLDRLLSFLERDTANLALRKDAVREACGVGQWEAARKLIDTGLEANDNPELLALSGFAHLQSGRYNDAERALSAALAQGLNAPEVNYNLAFAHFMSRRYPQALEWLADPLPQAVPQALLLRARCLHHLQNPQEAIADCRLRLTAAPYDADTHGLLGLLLHEQNRSDEAIEHIEAALKHSPVQLDALLTLASLQSDAHEYDAARLSFDRLLQAHPQCGRGWLGSAMIHLTHMQLEAAKRDIELAATYMPDHIDTWHVLAWTHLMLGDIEAAEMAFDKALALDPNFGETLGGLAVIAVLQEREEVARAGIERALRQDPPSVTARYAEMLLLQRHGEQDEAQTVLDTFLASPAAQEDALFRDFVAIHMKYLQTRTDAEQVS